MRPLVKWLEERPLMVTVLAVVVAGGCVAAIAAAYGFSAFASAWENAHFGWLALVVMGEVLAPATYALAYQSLARVEGGPELSTHLVVRVVAAGFGPHAVSGGFALDKRALHAVGGDERGATVRVLGLGALEWALLAPVTCIAAAVLLGTGDEGPMPSVLWPWVIAVPIGFAGGLWLARPSARERLCAERSDWRALPYTALCGVGVLPMLARDISGFWRAWAGMALYWALDIAAFYGAARFFGLRPNAGEIIVAYATGYALTRRSMPLGGAGVTEAFLTFSLHWMGLAVAPALATVVLYRIFNLAAPAVPALVAHPRIDPLLKASADNRTPAHPERDHARTPLA